MGALNARLSMCRGGDGDVERCAYRCRGEGAKPSLATASIDVLDELEKDIVS
jgi:hypothetical protein